MKPRDVVLLLLIVGMGAPSAQSAPARPLKEGLDAIAKDLKQALTTDPKLKGQRVRIGSFDNGNVPDTNFGPKIKRFLTEALGAQVSNDAEFIVKGRYDKVDSAEEVGQALKVIRIRATLEDKQTNEQFKTSVEVNDSDDIALLLGANVAPDFNAPQKKRNDQVHEAHERPKFHSLGTKIRGSDNNHFAMEIWVKETPTEPGKPVQVQNQGGRPFVDIPIKKYYDVVLYNETSSEMAASLTVDGLETISTFNEDKVKPGHYLIPPRGEHRIRGWMKTANQEKSDNTLTFLVTELGQGAATKLKSQGEIGVITAQFSASWKEGDEPPPLGRTTAKETTTGPAIPDKVEIVKRNIGRRIETISVRYNLPN